MKHSLEFSPQGIASLNDELFMIRNCSSCIDVYNIEPFAFQRTITVAGMQRPFDIVAVIMFCMSVDTTTDQFTESVAGRKLCRTGL